MLLIENDLVSSLYNLSGVLGAFPAHSSTVVAAIDRIAAQETEISKLRDALLGLLEILEYEKKDHGIEVRIARALLEEK